MKKSYEFSSVQGGKAIVEIDNNKLTIKRKGILAFFKYGSKGSKTIMINQISAIQLKESNIRIGFIQFVIIGSQEVKGNFRDTMNDENTILFGCGIKSKDNAMDKNAKEIKRYIENYNSKAHNTIVQNVKSPIEQIKDLKELLDIGAITQEEFDAKKKQLLNL